MEKHKDKALEDRCKCKECEYRFQCFTNERIFSDPLYQGLYEALIALGRSKEEALEEVTRELKINMQPKFDLNPEDWQPSVQPWYTGGGLTSGGTWEVSNNTVNYDADIQVTYTMSTGEEIKVNVHGNRFN